MISAKVIKDSKNELNNRITTMVVTMPRFILAEFNTHRVFSRNSASSRAIPFEKMVKSVEENPFIPIAWQKDHKGMQGTEYITNKNDLELNKTAWLLARDSAISSAKYLNHGIKEGRNNGVTKQLCNRLLEPFMYHTVIVTATEWENFFALRCPKYEFKKKTYRSKKDALIEIEKVLGESDFSDTDDYLQWTQLNKGQAEIHMMVLAEAMWDTYNESTPQMLHSGDWHIPFDENMEDIEVNLWDSESERPANLKEIREFKIKIATARCARVSYTIVGEEGKESNYANDIKLHDSLAKSGHWSPFEHCAQVIDYGHISRTKNSVWSGNFKGFLQYRKTFHGENLDNE